MQQSHIRTSAERSPHFLHVPGTFQGTQKPGDSNHNKAVTNSLQLWCRPPITNRRHLKVS